MVGNYLVSNTTSHRFTPHRNKTNFKIVGKYVKICIYVLEEQQ